MRDKNFYDYGFFEEYTKAKACGDTKKCVEMQHKCYDQFLDVAHKMKWNLVKRLQKTYATPEEIFDMTSDYEHTVYPELVKAMDCIRMEAIPKKKKKNGQYAWNFYAAYWGYLSTYNRDTVAHYIKKAQNEVNTDFQIAGNIDDSASSNLAVSNEAALISEKFQSQSPEKLYEQKCERKAFWKAVDTCVNKRFSSIQKEIWNLKKDSEKRISSKEVCLKLNITQAIYNREMKAIKETFSKELAIANEKYF